MYCTGVRAASKQADRMTAAGSADLMTTSEQSGKRRMDRHRHQAADGCSLRLPAGPFFLFILMLSPSRSEPIDFCYRLFGLPPTPTGLLRSCRGYGGPDPGGLHLPYSGDLLDCGEGQGGYVSNPSGNRGWRTSCSRMTLDVLPVGGTTGRGGPGGTAA